MSTEETNGVTPNVHTSPIESEAADASGVTGGVTSDGAFVPEDAQDGADVEANASNQEVPTMENTEHGIVDAEEVEEETEEETE